MRARGQQSEKQGGPDAYETRDLSAKHYVYFGPMAGAGLEDAAQRRAVHQGPNRSGKKELVGLIDGVGESAQSWKDSTARPEAARTWGARSSRSPTARSAFGRRSRKCGRRAAANAAGAQTANVLNKLPHRNIDARVCLVDHSKIEVNVGPNAARRAETTASELEGMNARNHRMT